MEFDKNNTTFNKPAKGTMQCISENNFRGFTQEQIYKYGGRYDSVFTLTLRENSDSYLKYGETITVCFVYNLKERKAMENDMSALNKNSYIKAKLLRSNHDKKQEEELLKVGINTKDIVSMIILHSTEENNTFPSKEKRTPYVLGVPINLLDKGKDIYWIYSTMKKTKAKGVGFMPEEEAQYLAFKLILEKEELTAKEKKIIFDDKGKMHNDAVTYYYLLWRNAAGILDNEQKYLLNKLWTNKIIDRIVLTNKMLNNCGLNYNKLIRIHPQKANYLARKILEFNDISFNIRGRFPLYMNFKSFLHIYFRHSEELNVSSQFANRDKFQLEEKDIISVMDIVINALNNEYQTYKENNPNGIFYRKGEMAYYYNGDYYNIVVNTDGSISTFYKGTGK